jgi:Flp pilus assembly protein TadD
MSVGQDDPVMARIGEAVQQGHAGDPAGARLRFAEIWADIGPGGDPLHRCALAHYAADVQEDPAEELRWDRRALAAADEVGDDRARALHPSLDVAAFYPSLHLNLADVLRRLGDAEQAGEHLGRAMAALDALPDDGYGRMIRDGVERCAARLAAGETA